MKSNFLFDEMCRKYLKIQKLPITHDNAKKKKICTYIYETIPEIEKNYVVGSQLTKGVLISHKLLICAFLLNS